MPTLVHGGSARSAVRLAAAPSAGARIARPPGGRPAHLRFSPFTTDPIAPAGHHHQARRSACTRLGALERLTRPVTNLSRAKAGNVCQWIDAKMPYRIPRQSRSHRDARPRPLLLDKATVSLAVAFRRKLRLYRQRVRSPPPGAASGLGLRPHRPRITSSPVLGGGTGSGMVPRRRLTSSADSKQLASAADVIGRPCCRPSTAARLSTMSLGNALRRLTGLHHYASRGRPHRPYGRSTAGYRYGPAFRPHPPATLPEGRTSGGLTAVRGVGRRLIYRSAYAAGARGGPNRGRALTSVPERLGGVPYVRARSALLAAPPRCNRVSRGRCQRRSNKRRMSKDRRADRELFKAG